MLVVNFQLLDELLPLHEVRGRDPRLFVKEVLDDLVSHGSSVLPLRLDHEDERLCVLVPISLDGRG